MSSKNAFPPPPDIPATPDWLPLAEVFVSRLRQAAEETAAQRGSDKQKVQAEKDAATKPAHDAVKPAGNPPAIVDKSEPGTNNAATDAEIEKILAVGDDEDIDEDLASALCEAAPDDLVENDDLRERINDPVTLALSSDLPPLTISTLSLSLALRLAVAIRSPDVLASWLRPGAVTRITGMEREELEKLAKVIRDVVLPKGLSVGDRADAEIDKHDVLLLSTSAQDLYYRDRSFIRDIETGLEGQQPIIILEPSDFQLPQHLAASLPDVVTLPAPNRRVIYQHLRLSHGLSTANPGKVMASLPPDSDLARLTVSHLRVAFRAAPVSDVIARLHRALPPARAAETPRLEDIAGDGPALSAARRMVADLKSWQRGDIAWGELSHSLLLYGPPGTGKTWLARAMGASAGITFHQASFAKWQSAGHLGDMLGEMRRTFAEASRNPPAILFVDEIDAAGSRDDDDSHSRNYRRQVINGFLEQIDLLTQSEGVLLIGACNDPSVLDPAIVRPGRFDLHAEVPLPDATMVRGMLAKALAKDLPVLAEEDHDADAEDVGIETVLDELVFLAVGRSAAAIDAAIRDARSRARARLASSWPAASASSIPSQSHSSGPSPSGLASGAASATHPLRLSDLREAFGASFRNSARAMEWRVCVHECGHAIFCAAMDLGSVTRIALTEEGGHIARDLRPAEAVLSDMTDEIAYSLAGRAAEILVLGSPSGGAGVGSQSDLALATNMALAIETRLGLGIYGSLWIENPSLLLHRDERLRAKVRTRLEDSEQHALRVLAGHEALLIEMARALFRKRRFDAADMRPWLTRVSREPRAEERRMVNTPSADQRSDDMPTAHAPRN